MQHNYFINRQISLKLLQSKQCNKNKTESTWYYNIYFHLFHSFIRINQKEQHKMQAKNKSTNCTLGAKNKKKKKKKFLNCHQSSTS